MTEWWQRPYNGGPMAVPAKYFPRPLFPPDAAPSKQPSRDGPDVMAYKRTISRLGRWKPWSPSTWDDSFNNKFSQGRGTGGNVGDTGVAGVQRQMAGTIPEATGWIDQQTFNVLASCRVPEDPAFPHAGEMAMDPNSVNLIMQAYAIYGGQAEPPDDEDTLEPIVKTTRERALEAAQADVGYVEGGNNDTLYGQWFGLNFNPYCAMALSYWFEVDAGGSPSFSAGSAYSYCPYMLSDAKAGRNGLSLTSSPIPGDAVLMDFQWDSVADHVGIFESGTAQSFTTVEANTSPEGGGGSQSNGGGVYRRNRTQSSAQIWFVRVAEP